jgi:Transmembrane secretion effector
VSLVQTASALPMVLLALVGGVLSDAFDRRRLMIWVQVYFVVVASMLSLLSSMHLVPPLLLLAFTFAIGVGSAIQLPTWWDRSTVSPTRTTCPSTPSPHPFRQRSPLRFADYQEGRLPQPAPRGTLAAGACAPARPRHGSRRG